MMWTKPVRLLPALLALLVLPLSTSLLAQEGGKKLKVANIPLRSDGPKSLDPVYGSTTYDNRVCCQFYETLLQYKYLVDPPTLEPLLLAEMPTLSESGDGGVTYHFQLKSGVRFHDDACFPDGRGRTVVSSDVFYSWKRMADDDNKPKVWWLFENAIEGFDEFRADQNSADTFDYDAPVAGFKVINDLEFEVRLKKPITRFPYVLAMFQTSIVAREAVEKYGKRFGRHPVGTGPFVLRSESDWVTAKSIDFYRNPNYHECFYPKEASEAAIAGGLDLAAGARLPIVDKVHMSFFVNENTMWLAFESGDIDYVQVPKDPWPEVFLLRSRKIKKAFRNRGISSHPLKLLDFIFYGFNMEDELLGGYTDEKRYLRKAMALVVDWEERNQKFYNSLNAIYDGMIPPGLEGHPEGGRLEGGYRGPDLERAREYLAKAGYPGGKGLPVIQYYTSIEGNGPKQARMLKRLLKQIGIELNLHLTVFSTLNESVHNKKAQFFSFAWGSDYPDAENNLALFYGPNEAPGSNSFNYKNAEYDKLYDQIKTMQPSAKRTALYIKMRDMVMEDAPYFGSMARIRWYIKHPWLKNLKPAEIYSNWLKYLDVDKSQEESHRQ